MKICLYVLKLVTYSLDLAHGLCFKMHHFIQSKTNFHQESSHYQTGSPHLTSHTTVERVLVQPTFLSSIVLCWPYYTQGEHVQDSQAD